MSKHKQPNKIITESKHQHLTKIIFTNQCGRWEEKQDGSDATINKGMNDKDNIHQSMWKMGREMRWKWCYYQQGYDRDDCRPTLKKNKYVFSVSCIVSLCTFLYFCFTISWRPTTKRDGDGDEPTNQPVEKMVIQYFRWRCKLIDDRTIQDEFSKDGWKWWNMWDGYYDLYGEMIQQPRWMCYDQQLTVVKQICKEFVKVTIQWNWLVICSTQIQGIYFLFDVLSFLAHSCIFVSPFAEDQPQNEMNTVMDQRTSLLIKWWSNTSDGDVSYLRTVQSKVNSEDNWKWWKIWILWCDYLSSRMGVWDNQ